MFSILISFLFLTCFHVLSAQPVDLAGSSHKMSGLLNHRPNARNVRSQSSPVTAFSLPPRVPNPFQRPKMGSHYLFRDLLNHEVWNRPDTPRQEIMDRLFRVKADQLTKLGGIYTSLQFQGFLDRESEYLWKDSDYFMMPFIYDYYFENISFQYDPDQVYFWLKRLFEYTRYMGKLPQKVDSDSDYQYDLKRKMHQMSGILESPVYADDFAPLMPTFIIDYLAAASKSALLQQDYHSSKLAKILVICLRYLHTWSVKNSSDAMMEHFISNLSELEDESKMFFLKIVRESRKIENSIDLIDAESVAYRVPVERFYAKLMDAWPEVFFQVDDLE